MESKVAKDAERSLIEATQRLSPEERLNAYLEHCRHMMDLYEAGQRLDMTWSKFVPGINGCPFCR